MTRRIHSYYAPVFVYADFKEDGYMDAKPSRTAYRVALRRAAHQMLDTPKIFEDPLAASIAGVEETAKFVAESQAGEHPASRSLRAFLVARSRYAENRLMEAISEGVRQYVVLGAGLDTFAYRSPRPDLTVFEVDHPATQAWKRFRLQNAGIAVPAQAVFVPVDFERENLRENLRKAGFQFDQPSFFSWLGVVPYLTPGAFQETLEFIASLPLQSGVVFDYAIPRSSLNEAERLAFDMLAARVASIGEPFQLFFEPHALLARLQEIGFGQVEDLGAPDISARYFQGRSDGLDVTGRAGHLLCARI